MEAHETRLLVVSLERDCQRDPRGYLRRVIGLTLLGYAFPAGMVVAILALVGLLVISVVHGRALSGLPLFGLPLGVVIWMVVKTLSVKMGPPEGIRLTRQEARRLLEMTAALCRAARAPRLRGVLLTGEFDVRVVQVPLASMVGLHRNYLVIGLPVLLSLSPEELLSMVAHELGHLSRTHGGFAVWVHSMRVIWTRLLAEVGRRDDHATYLFRRFAAWYSQLYNAYTYILARRHELATDKLAAKLTKAEHVAQALVRLRLTAGWLGQRFWPDTKATARRDIHPPEHVFSAMARSIAGMPQEAAELLPFLGPAEQTGAAPDDPHPSLAERLKSLGQPLAPPPTCQHNAAQEFLGQSLEEVEGGLSDAWRMENEQEWELAHAEARDERKRLELLDAKHLARTLTHEEAWERATILQREGNMAEFEHAALEMTAHGPPFAPALYALGRAMLARGDEQGLAYLDRAMEVSESGGYDACQAAQAFLSIRGRAADAQRYVQKAVEVLTLMERARAERQGYNPREPVEPHGLRPEALESIKTQLAGARQVREAYLARKRVSRMRDQPMYVMGVHMVRTWWRLPGQQAQDLREQLKRNIEMPGEWFCLVLDLQTPGFQQRFKNVAGEPVYVRE